MYTCPYVYTYIDLSLSIYIYMYMYIRKMQQHIAKGGNMYQNVAMEGSAAIYGKMQQHGFINGGKLFLHGS